MSIDIENTGDKCGKEVVQLYVAMPTSEVIRPIKELRRFEKIELAPREKKTVKFTLNGRDFSYWNAEIHDWLVESGC